MATKSIVDKDGKKRKTCYLCGRYGVEEHHLIGSYNRKWSEKYGLKIYICRSCHEKAHSVPYFALELKCLGQEEFEKKYGTREYFFSIFGKDYIGYKEYLDKKGIKDGI